MFPCSTANDIPNSTFVSVFAPEFRLACAVCVLLAYLSNLSLRKFSVVSVFATLDKFRMFTYPHIFGLNPATLCVHILMVLRSRALPNVKRITARRIVARVADIEFAGVFVVVKPIRYAVGAVINAMDVVATIPTTLVIDIANPKPAAGRCNLNLFPEVGGDLRGNGWKATILNRHDVLLVRSIVLRVASCVHSTGAARFICGPLYHGTARIH